ncbi:MAG: hypothetical protein KME67_19330 [Candidatus Thiodiazotropha sp. (ex Codakia orbicularis)]|nr:hypothetical protein [Candidatus Thiodiazotropha sp. (ex Codakia orbicularis)]
MGNYHNLEQEFIERTLHLIEQYYSVLDNYPFEEQFNYTLTINCLLGLIVMPKEKVISYIPTDRLTSDYLKAIGAPTLEFNGEIRTLRDLIISLRHAIAHFDIKVVSVNERYLVDWLEFSDSENGGGLVARFQASELLPFLRHYASCLLDNMKKHRDR